MPNGLRSLWLNGLHDGLWYAPGTLPSLQHGERQAWRIDAEPLKKMGQCCWTLAQDISLYLPTRAVCYPLFRALGQNAFIGSVLCYTPDCKAMTGSHSGCFMDAAVYFGGGTSFHPARAAARADGPTAAADAGLRGVQDAAGERGRYAVPLPCGEADALCGRCSGVGWRVPARACDPERASREDPITPSSKALFKKGFDSPVFATAAVRGGGSCRLLGRWRTMWKADVG
jgi:hypothetical protein